jgi:hypothetical protein
MEGLAAEELAAAAGGGGGGGVLGEIVDEGKHIVNKVIDPTLDAAGEELRDYLLPGHETPHPPPGGGGGAGRDRAA